MAIRHIPVLVPARCHPPLTGALMNPLSHSAAPVYIHGGIHKANSCHPALTGALMDPLSHSAAPVYIHGGIHKAIRVIRPSQEHSLYMDPLSPSAAPVYIHGGIHKAIRVIRPSQEHSWTLYHPVLLQCTSMGGSIRPSVSSAPHRSTHEAFIIQCCSSVHPWGDP